MAGFTPEWNRYFIITSYWVFENQFVIRIILNIIRLRKLVPWLRTLGTPTGLSRSSLFLNGVQVASSSESLRSKPGKLPSSSSARSYLTIISTFVKDI